MTQVLDDEPGAGVLVQAQIHCKMGAGIVKGRQTEHPPKRWQQGPVQPAIRGCYGQRQQQQL